MAFIITTTNRCCYRNYTVNKLTEQGRGRKMINLKKKSKKEEKAIRFSLLINESLTLKSYLISPGFPINTAWIMYDQ